MAYSCYLLKSPHCVTGHVGDASRSYYQGQRSDPSLPLEKQGNIDPRSQSREGDMEVGYENNLLSEAFEGLEQRFLDDIMKLAKEQTDAEDAENARHREVRAFCKKVLFSFLFSLWYGVVESDSLWLHHYLSYLTLTDLKFCLDMIDESSVLNVPVLLKIWAVDVHLAKLWRQPEDDGWDSRVVSEIHGQEKIMTINAQYGEQLAALRTRHTNRRKEFLRKESHARQQQYQQAAMDQYPNRGMDPGDPHGYSAAAAPGGEPHPYSADQYDSYRERARYLGGARDRFDPRGQHPGGRVYSTGSRYY
ncbi:hypothetical protein RJ639_017545 [Escallonia herrerae]|uniref:Uncharacterized protein n=1 Tax=Escallonia herrerae TaxID=1293975 RepID=A0AA88VAV8_9ASTE|nr:hypothetical protein RJ639_017545 [Escallonia herrerae]